MEKLLGERVWRPQVIAAYVARKGLLEEFMAQREPSKCFGEELCTLMAYC